MTKTEFVRVLSRAFALYLLAGALLECTYLPQFLYSLMHHLSEGRAFVNQSYWRGYYILETSSLVLRIAAMILGVLFFWTAGACSSTSCIAVRKGTRRTERADEFLDSNSDSAC